VRRVAADGIDASKGGTDWTADEVAVQALLVFMTTGPLVDVA
jgi:hypothetical protein